MGRTSNPKWLIYVRESLFDSSAQIRIEAINAFSELCDVEMAEELTELIDDPELSVQLATIFALKKIGGRQSVMLLIKSLKNPEPEVISASIDSLRFISQEDNVDLNLFNESNELGKKKNPSEKEDNVLTLNKLVNQVPRQMIPSIQRDLNSFHNLLRSLVP